MSRSMTASEVIAHLELEPHPEEGGYFVETYRAKGQHPAGSLGDQYQGPRSHCTAIYYLLTPKTRSEMHRLPTDEVFHFYAGDPVEQLRLYENGESEVVVLGNDLSAGQWPQALVPGGTWQGARLGKGGQWALLGCTVAPGFEFADYESGDRATLVAQAPDHEALVVALTRDP